MFPVKTILCPLDFSDNSVKALTTAVELAGLFKAKIILGHVITDLPSIGAAYGMIDYNPPASNIDDFMDEMVKASEKEFSALIRKYGNESVRFETKISRGIAVDEISRMAESEHADLIVLTTHGRTGLSRLLMGSVAEGVIRHAKCPVLSLRIKEGPHEKS
jgi:universal stress protein A